MRRAFIPLFLAVLMVTIPWASVAPAPTDQSLEQSQWTAAEAAENWFESEGSPGGNVAISSGSGQLWVQTGNFDPLYQTASIPSNLQASEDPFATGYIIVQLFQNDGVLAESIAKGVGAQIVDTLPEDAWVLRLPNSVHSRSNSIVQLAEDDRVRWVGAQQPAWRLDVDLHQASGVLDLDLTLAQDVDTSQLEEHLYMAGSEFVHCDSYICQ